MEAGKHACLNCDALLTGAYCSSCGQKADTHRITMKHLIEHDLVHGIWHFDKGLLYTVRESFVRPGSMAIDYIRGKRVKYYNVFYLILIVLGLNLLLAKYFKEYYHIVDNSTHKGLVVDEDTVDVSYYVKSYLKFLLFLIIPVFALSGLASFRKLRLNFAEHMVIGSHLLLAGAMWYFFVIVGLYTSIEYGSVLFNSIVWAVGIMVMIQPIRLYYPAAKNEYTMRGFVLRMLLWYAIVAVLLFCCLLIVAGLTGKTHIKIG
jgi:hypothetical protein